MYNDNKIRTQYTIIWEKFTVGNFHVKIFSSSWVKYSYFLPYFFNGKIFHVLNFHPNRLQNNFFNGELFPNNSITIHEHITYTHTPAHTMQANTLHYTHISVCKKTSISHQLQDVVAVALNRVIPNNGYKYNNFLSQLVYKIMITINNTENDYHKYLSNTPPSVLPPFTLH